ncbi:hypothetical protein [Pseudoalteromonas sp. S16_S37]|uniref:hypothetical protein n=1 Tax=Pseudoalteromonas sp. S16_S37 TaxID=2720228 RepID=UPI00168114B3|nr:hypothetical protein [Pseudoalteromonas sp. S16_S37]MBD1584728.1 hypothetical protein [Pseudoalteromonas sp. S16_S37]
MNYFLQFLLLTSLVLSCNVKAEFTAPSLLENNNSKLPSRAKNGTRTEAWVRADFVVNESGKAEHILLEMSDPNYYHDAKEYLSQLQYQSATFNGKPMKSAGQFTIKFHKIFSGVSNDGISSSYAKYFDITKAQVVNSDKQASLSLDNLTNEHTKNLTEQAYSAWLNSVYYASVQDWQSYDLYVKESALLYDLLTPDLALMSMQNLMNLYVYQLHLSDARQTLLAMANIKYKTLSQQTVDQFTAQLHQLMNDNPVIKIEAQLSKHKTWRHTLNRSTISLLPQQGKVSAAALYCQNGYHAFTSQSIEEFSVPEAFGECRLVIQGDEATKIVFTESGASRFGLSL